MNLNKSEKTGSFREVLNISFPLIMSSSGHAIRIFSDRVMLSNYSAKAVAASMSAGLTCFMFMSFFMGIVGYANTFVAQYKGSEQNKNIGPAVWQAAFLAVAGGVFVAGIGSAADVIFSFIGHPAEIQGQQVIYFKILTIFSTFPLLVVGMLSFWSGRGKTRFCMYVELGSAALNVFLNYILIFGNLGFESMGIKGAAYATGVSSLAGFLVCAVVFFQREKRETYNTFPKIKFNKDIFNRMLKFGLPNGLHFFLDITAFNIFVAVLGRMGNDVMEATSIAFSINTIAFMPIVGIGMAVSIIVGQSIGAGDIKHALASVKNSLAISFIYMLIIGIAIVFFPEIFLSLYERENDVMQTETHRLAAVFLKYIAAFLFFDAMFIIYNSAIKGAGDTKWSMRMGVLLSWGIFAMPSAVAYAYGCSIYFIWSIAVLYVFIAGTVFYIRYRGGKWQKMNVIGLENR
ncbi:MAG: MATE family efflux transporter [Planctomycetota bacterium]|jgi:MATE family multidrug resistance protein